MIAILALLSGANRAAGDETTTAVTEYQAKALFLLNFAKYVDWPSESFATSSAPIVIGVVGKFKFGGELAKAVEGKSVDGRKIVVRQFAKNATFGKCQILFVGISEKKQLDEILGRTKSLPILTVGESERFLLSGGVINFTKKEGKVRIEIDSAAARRAGLQISSKLLKVADVVKGKP